MADDHKTIDVKEFREFGYLQEVNRCFFHPLGLALEVKIDEDGNETLGAVWDSRDDPEGFIFGPGMIEPQKRLNVSREWLIKAEIRKRWYGYVLQQK
jgi:hypothetical protein